jgi:CBS domain containing-hemolysin-like protein
VLNATELGIATLFVVALGVISIVEIAFSSINKIAFRRFLEKPEMKAAPPLASLLEIRTEVLLSIHLLIQSLMVAGAVFLFAAFNRRQVPYVAGIPGTVGLMFVLIVLFRQLIPRLIVARNPEMVLMYLFPVFRLCIFVMRPFARLMTAVLNYFHSWKKKSGPIKRKRRRPTPRFRHL